MNCPRGRSVAQSGSASVWGTGVVGSNPAAPTNFPLSLNMLLRVPQNDRLFRYGNCQANQLAAGRLDD